ncbi:MAG: hypothetical protein RR840_07005 [Clostridium sp.]
MINKAKYSEMPTSQIFSYLPKNNYEFLYKSFTNNKTYSYIDTSDKVNFCILCCNEDIMSILKAKKSIYVDKHNLGVVFKINLSGGSRTFEFVFDVFLNEDNNIIDRIISDRKIMISFIVSQGTTLNKGFHLDFAIDDPLKERLEYIKNTTYNMAYPRINEDEYTFSSGKYIEVDYNLNIVESIINACDRLSKWKSSDSFTISLLYDESIKVVFSGECRNIGIIKDEINKIHPIISEGTTNNPGVPVLNYTKGYLYFYEYNRAN